MTNGGTMTKGGTMTIGKLMLVPVAAAVLCAAPAAAKIAEADAEELVRVTGLEAQIRNIPESLEMNLRRQQRNQQALSQEQLEKVEAVLDRAASPDELLGWVVDGVAGELDPKHLEPLLSFSRSELGSKIVERERKTADPEVAAEIASNADQLLADEAARERAQRIEELVNGTDLSMTVFKKTQVALAAAMVTARQPERSLELATLEETVDSRADQFREQIKRLTLAQSAHVYGPLGDEEFERYTDFLATDAAQHYFDVVRDAVGSALTRYGQQITGQSGAAAQAQ